MNDLMELMNDYAHWNTINDLAESLLAELHNVYCQDADLKTTILLLSHTAETHIREISNAVRDMDEEEESE